MNRYYRIVAMAVFVAFLGACSTQSPNQDLELVSSFAGSGGDHKADAPNKVMDWQILQADPQTVVLRALDGAGDVYFEAWVERQGRILRVDYLAPEACVISLDSISGHQIENSCSLEQVGILGITTLDFVRDLDSSNLALQMVEQKADGIGENVCTTAQVVLGGVGGLITTMAIFHESIFYLFGASILGGPVGISAAGIGLGALVFALGAVGTAWGVGEICDLIGVGEHDLQLARCVDGCDLDSEECASGCMAAAASEEGVVAGLEECNTNCDQEADCLDNCTGAFGSDTNLRQTLLAQCVMGCGGRGQACAQVCVDALNNVFPNEVATP